MLRNGKKCCFMQLRRFMLIALLLICSALMAFELTPDEISWLEQHPVIRLGIGESWAPFIFPAENGQHKGYDIDLITMINEIAGTKIEIVPGKWNEIVEMAKNHELDGLAESAANDERREFFRFTEPYLIEYYALVTTPDQADKIRSEEDLHGKKIASIKGNAWLDKLLASLENVQIIRTGTEIEAFNLVRGKKADASFLTLGMFSEYRKLFHENITIAHIFNDEQYKMDLLYSIRKDWPELVVILNKALASISEEEKLALYNKWYGFTANDFQSWTRTQLTAEEAAWLAEHKVIRIAPDPQFPPIEWFDEDGQYLGITAEFMELIEKALNVNFEVVQCQNWDEVLKKAENREIDLLPAAAQTPGRAEYMLFSEPHLVFPGVIITTKENHELNNTRKLYGKDVGIVSGYVWYEFFSHDHPQINIVPVKNIVEGLRKVSLREIDAFIVTLPIALYYIEQEGILNLIVAGETEYKTKLSIQTRKDWPLLNSIISKALKAIPSEKKKSIINKWIHLDSVSIFRNRLFWIISLSILGFFSAVIFIIFLWNKTLRKQVKIKTHELQEDLIHRKKLETELAASEAKYKSYIDNAPNGIFITDQKGKYLMVNKAACKITGYSESELLTMHTPDLLPPESQDFGKKHFGTVKKTGNASGETAFLKKSGELRYWQVNAVKISEDRFLSFVNDITDKKTSELELEKYKTQLEDLVKERTRELEDKNKKLEEFNKLFVGREFRIKELKNKVEELEEKLNGQLSLSNCVRLLTDG